MKFWKILLTGSGAEKPPQPDKKTETESGGIESEKSQAEVEQKRKEIMEKMIKGGAEVKQGHTVKSDRKRKGTFTKKQLWATEDQKKDAKKEMEEDLAKREQGVSREEIDIKEGEKEKLVLVDVTRDIKAEARDKALHNMTASREELKGFKGFLTKVWKHNLFQDYYLTKETYKEEEGLRDSYGKGAPHIETTIKRFASEYEEAIHGEAGEKRTFEDLTEEAEAGLKKDIQDLVVGFAKGELDEASFQEEKNRVLEEVRGEKDASVYADNLLDMARHIEARVKHGEAIDAIDEEFEIVLGEARGGVRTEADLTTVEKIVDKIQKTKMGSMANEATVATAVSLAYSLTAGVSRRIASNRLVAAATFGGTAVLAGGIAGLREKRRVKVERAQHIRERAQGKEFEEDAERRKEMDEFTYETKPARELVDEINMYLNKDKFSPGDPVMAVVALAEAESRIQISDRENIDLISYSSRDNVDEERLQLDIARAKLKTYLKKFDREGELSEESPFIYHDFDDLLEHNIMLKSSALREGERGLDATDQSFNKYKRNKVAKAAVKGATVGALLGMTAQEVAAEVRGDQQGLAEGSRGIEKESRNITPLESMRQWFDTPSPDSKAEVFEASEFNEVGSEALGLEEGVDYRMPTGLRLQEDDGVFDVLHRDEVVVGGIEINPDGRLPEESIIKLEEAGFEVDADTHFVEVPGEPSAPDASEVPGAEEGTEIVTREVASEEFIQQNQEQFTQVERVAWYDNSTPGVFDKNELALHWGGPEGVGVDEGGNFVLDVSSMTSEGSFTDGLSVDAKQAIQEGRLSMLFSMDRGTQNFVWKVPINMDGEAVMDPDSELGKIFFEKDSSGRAIFKGQYAEVAEVVGEEDGVEQVRLLATHVGEGVDRVEAEEAVSGTEQPNLEPDTSTEPELKQITEYEIDYNKEVEVPLEDPTVEAPPVIPLVSRKPLEPMKDKKKEEAKLSPEKGGAVAAVAEAGQDKNVSEEKEYEYGDLLKISAGEEIKKKLEEKLKIYQDRMSKREQWLDREGLNPNRSYEDSYFKATLIEKLLDNGKANPKDIEKSLREEYGDKMNEKKFKKAVEYLEGFIKENDEIKETEN